MERATFATADPERLEGAFRAVAGVHGTRVGPDDTVDVDHDPWTVSYGTLLEVFWGAHDPTQPGSAILPHTVEQHVAAVASRDREQERLGPERPLATEIVSGLCPQKL